MIDAVTKPKTRVKTKTERPHLHKVILVNDDYTPREFVVTVLKAEFRMTEDQAQRMSPRPRQRAPPTPAAPRATRCCSPPSRRNDKKSADVADLRRGRFILQAVDALGL